MAGVNHPWYEIRVISTHYLLTEIQLPVQGRINNIRGN